MCMRPALLALCFAGIARLAAPSAAAQKTGMQSAGPMPPMDEIHAVPPPEQLPVPLRMTSIGNSHIAIKANAEAQAWFDQGLSLMHDFWDYESAKAFQQAIRTDPSCAMCYWGLARAIGFRGEADKV